MDRSPEDAQTYRAPSGIPVLVVCTLLGVFLLGDAVVRGSWGLMLLYAPWVLLVLWGICVISVVSMVRVDQDGAVVQNFLRRTSFGWRRVVDIELRWQLQFRLDDGRTLSCWGGPGRIQAPRTNRKGDEVTVPHSLRTLTEVRGRWERAIDAAGAAGVGAAGAGAAGVAGSGGSGVASSGAALVDAPIRRRWHWPALGSLALLVVWAAIAVAVTR